VSTPTFALPYPSLSSIPNVPADFQALADATEAAILKSRVQTLAPSQFKPITPASSYPIGVSMMMLSDADAAAGNWPFKIAATVIAIASAAGSSKVPTRVTQLWSSAQATPALFMRNSTGSASWGAWWRVGPSISGYAALYPSKADAVATGTIVLPKYSFMSNPRTLATGFTTSPNTCQVSTANPTTPTSFTAYTHRNGSASGLGFNWTCIDLGAASTPAKTFAAPFPTDTIPAVDGTFRHAVGSECPEVVNDPRVVPIPADQTEWNGAFDSTCGEKLERIG
jgi:hypothetical protein